MGLCASLNEMSPGGNEGGPACREQRGPSRPPDGKLRIKRIKHKGREA